MTKKSQIFSRKMGDTHQLPPRVTPTLVTPLLQLSNLILLTIVISTIDFFLLHFLKVERHQLGL